MKPACNAALCSSLMQLLLCGCKTGAKHVTPGAPELLHPERPSTADGRAVSMLSPQVFSAPIGVARVGRTDIIAGLVASDRTVRALGVVDGNTVWTRDVLQDVAWTPDAELRLQPAGDGAAILWRGLRAGKPTRTLVLVGAGGEARSDPMEVGFAFCANQGALAWIGPHTSGPQVLARRWSEPEARAIATLSPEREPALVCAEHDVVILGEGDDDLTVSRWLPSEAAARSPVVILRDNDFSDEQREHEAYSAGDDITLVRVGATGSLALRDVPRDGEPRAWHRLKHALSQDDDVVAVDGDRMATFVVFTHDADLSCGGLASVSESVRALRIDRQTGEESIVELEAAECGISRGPFWIAAGRDAPVVSWIERRTTRPAKTASIVGLAFRGLRAEGPGAGRIDQPADALVTGGCNALGCAAAALVREPGSDGMKPAAIRLLNYP